MKKLSAFFLILFVYCTSSFAQYEKQTTYLDTYLETAVKAYNLPSLSIGIVKDGEIIFQKSYGFLKNGEETKADENSIYGIASLSKAFTTACIAMLVDEGKLKMG